MQTNELEQLDVEVYRATCDVRRDYIASCQELGLTPTELTKVTLGMRSVK